MGSGTTGNGWTGAWDVGSFTYSGSASFSESYQPGGLTFSSLPVSGGNAFLSTAWNGGLNVGRAHSASTTGTLFGSYLFQRTVNTSSNIELFSLWEGNDINGADNFGDFSIEPDRYQSSLGGVIGNQSYGTTTGTAISTGTTYLVLFKVTNLGPTSATHDATMWILQADQYDNFLPGGLDEAELNSAATGTAATQILQRASHAFTNTAQFASGNLLMMQNYYFSAQARYDEIRISDTSLNEVITVPEPTSGLLLASATLAFVATRRRRRVV